MRAALSSGFRVSSTGRWCVLFSCSTQRLGIRSEDPRSTNTGGSHHWRTQHRIVHPGFTHKSADAFKETGAIHTAPLKPDPRSTRTIGWTHQWRTQHWIGVRIHSQRHAQLTQHRIVRICAVEVSVDNRTAPSALTASRFQSHFLWRWRLYWCCCSRVIPNLAPLRTLHKYAKFFRIKLNFELSTQISIAEIGDEFVGTLNLVGIRIKHVRIKRDPPVAALLSAYWNSWMWSSVNRGRKNLQRPYQDFSRTFIPCRQCGWDFWTTSQNWKSQSDSSSLCEKRRHLVQEV